MLLESLLVDGALPPLLGLPLSGAPMPAAASASRCVYCFPSASFALQPTKEEDRGDSLSRELRGQSYFRLWGRVLLCSSITFSLRK